MNREQEEREEEEEEEEREEEETEAENYGDPTIPPDTQIDQYTIETLLLKPGNSEVYQCSSFDNDVKLVCKLIHKNVHLSELEAETRALTSLRHPFFMNLVDIKDFPDFRLLFFERYTEGDFLEYIRRSCKKRKIISENFLARFFFLLAVGFSHMHNSRFMHRDIKPENILIQTRRRLDNSEALFPIIIDFGFAKDMNEGEYLKEPKGTLYYAAPEVLLGHYYSFPADVWSYGVTLYTAATGQYPFYHNPDLTNLDFNTAPLERKLRRLGKSEAFIDFILLLLQFDPDSRPTFDSLLNHPWFTTYYSEEERYLDFNCF